MALTWITGVCWQATRLEWTVLRRVKESWVIHTQGHAEAPPNEDGVAEWTAATLKPHVREFRGRIGVALPMDSMLMRTALLPSTDADELRGMADLQVDKFSPFPVETMAIGTEALDGSDTSTLVAMATIKREIVDACGRIFQDAGAPADVLDVAALAWWWGMSARGLVPAHGVQVFLRDADSGLDVVVANDGKPLIFRSLSQPPADSEDPEEWAGECAEEIGYALTALETEWGVAMTPTLHVAHVTADAPAWGEALRREAGLESVFYHGVDKWPTVSEGVARRLAEPAEPLAMDLAPEEWRRADQARAMRQRLFQAATVFMAVWLLVVGGFWTLLNVQRGRLAKLEAQVEAAEEPAEAVRVLRSKMLELTQYADRSHSALECLRVVAEVLPRGTDLTSFIYRKGNTLTLRGDAEVADTVYGFIQALEQTNVFPEVKSEGVSTRNTPQGSRSQFGVTIRLPGGSEGES